MKIEAATLAHLRLHKRKIIGTDYLKMENSGSSCFKQD